MTMHVHAYYSNSGACIYTELMFYYTALTVDNIIRAVHGLRWRRLGEILFIPYIELDRIAQKYPTNDQREIAVVKHWPLVDPLISWRRVIHNLDEWSEHEMADRIRHYAEELTGIYCRY